MGMGAESGFARGAERKKQREKEQEEIGQQSKRMKTAKDDKNSSATTKPHHLEKQGGVTRNKAICGVSAPTDISSDVRPWELTLKPTRSQQTDTESLIPLPQRGRSRSRGMSRKTYMWNDRQGNHWRLDEFLAVSLFWNLVILVLILVRAIYRQIIEIEEQDRQERRARRDPRTDQWEGQV